MDVRNLPAQEDRVETGPVKFGDDWTGVFIRGDNAFYYATVLHALLSKVEAGEGLWVPRITLYGLVDLLRQSDERKVEDGGTEKT